MIVDHARPLFLLLGALLIYGITAAQAASLPASKRCAFDIGSGETKVIAAEVKFHGSRMEITRLMARSTPIPFARNLQNSLIPDFLISEAIAKINELKTACDLLGVRRYAGVATSGFRMAQNAQIALARISRETNIPLRVISGDEEAVVAFLAAATALNSDGRNLVVWDIGGGSLQWSMNPSGSAADRRNYVISSGQQGAELFRREVAAQLGREAARGVNPLTQEEITRAVELAKKWSGSVKPQIVERLRRDSMRVIGLGGIHVESLANQAGLEMIPPHQRYTLEGVRAASQRAVNMTDQDYRNAYPDNKYPESQATNVALVLGYMEGLQIKEVIPLDVNLADGLLADPTYWHTAKLRR